jgi:hypothetical protein
MLSLKACSGNEFIQAELEQFRSVIYNAMISAIRYVPFARLSGYCDSRCFNSDTLNGMRELNLPVQPENEEHSSTILSVPSNSRLTTLSDELIASLKALKLDKNVQRTRRRSLGSGRHSIVTYFLQSLDRITAASYWPSIEDITQAGIWIQESTIKNGKLTYKFFDPGPAWPTTMKQMHRFQDVNAIIYVADLSDYWRYLDGHDGMLVRARSSTCFRMSLTALFRLNFKYHSFNLNQLPPRAGLFAPLLYVAIFPNMML